MTLRELLIWWALFGVSNILLGASVGMLVKGGPFAKMKVRPELATFIFVCGMTLLLVAGKQNLLQATITFFFPG
ncbi:MAG: hypothetical protein ACOY93_02265 [Bacillota bacterium]